MRLPISFAVYHAVFRKRNGDKRDPMRDRDSELGLGTKEDANEQRRVTFRDDSASSKVRATESKLGKSEASAEDHEAIPGFDVDDGENGDNENDEPDLDDDGEESGAGSPTSPASPDDDLLSASSTLYSKSRPRRWYSRIKHFIRQSDPDGKLTEEFSPNYRWLPIVSGIIIPFSILLEIPGLTEHWYIRTEDNKIVETRRNPAILEVGLAFSIACALIANIAIILRFFEKRVKTMTIVAIVALTIHDIINIITVTSFGVIHRFNDGFTYGQSFWFTVCSTVASVFTNITLIYDLMRTADFATHGSGLTRKQCSLVIVVMILLCWIALGALINSILNQLSFIDGLYFTIVTIETVGFGDIFPHSIGARIFTAVHGAVGFLNLALAVATCNETIIESFEHSYRMRLNQLRERRRERKMHHAEARAKKKALKKQLREAGLPLYIHKVQVGGGRGRIPRKMHLNVAALSPEQLQAALQEALIEFEGEASSPTSGMRPELTSIDTSSSDTSIHTYEKFIAEDKREYTVKLTVVWSLFFTFWMIGSAIFMHTEGWSFGIAMWFCFEAFTTIGYGEFTPKTPAGRSVFIVWALLGVGTMTILISVLAEASSSRYHTALFGKTEREDRDEREERDDS